MSLPRTHRRLKRIFTLITLVGLTAVSAWAQARADYVGDSVCQSCHAAQTESFHQTAHFLTSSLPNEHSILGKFTAGDNTLKTSNPNLYFQMDANHGSFSQTAVAGTPPRTSTRTEGFALVVGSGEKGQTYLFRDDDQLFQLPVSYWTGVGWVNSPGYRDGFADFERAIIPRCLECHATRFEALPPPSNRYDKSNFALGIQCEKCHGPGREHVAQARSGKSTAILNPAHFSRDRQMDLCAWCHAGHGQALKPSFSYQPGDSLAEYIHFPPLQPNTPLDVHGNQVEMLKQSRCFRESGMTCLTCHNVHAPQHDLADFSQRCLTCHKPDSPTFAKSSHPVTNNCIDCHMPKQPSELIVSDFEGKRVRPEIRSHFIKIY